MNAQLRSTYLYVFTATVIFSAYAWWVFGVLGVAHFTGPDELVRIGRTIFSLIVFGYAFEITVVLGAALISVRLFKRSASDFVVDERDRQILYRSLHHSHLVLCTGVFASIGALALGWGAFWAFNVLVLGFLLSVVAELATKLYLYARRA